MQIDNLTAAEIDLLVSLVAPDGPLEAPEQNDGTLTWPAAMSARVQAVLDTDWRSGAAAHRREQLYAYAAAARWRHEIGGTTLTVGPVTYPVPTDREGRAALKQASDLLAAGELLDVTGNVRTTAVVVIQNVSATLDSAGLKALVARSAQRVQQLYDIQATVIAAIDAGTITTEAEIDAEF